MTGWCIVDAFATLLSFTERRTDFIFSICVWRRALSDANSIGIINRTNTAIISYSLCSSIEIVTECPVESFTVSVIDVALSKQELSYRKHIARQLRTQYVKGINSNPVTLKSRLSHSRKRNHWIDHITRLTISRVIWRCILLWPWNVG